MMIWPPGADRRRKAILENFPRRFAAAAASSSDSRDERDPVPF